MSHQITPLFSVEGQKMQAIAELRDQPQKMAIVIEFEQVRTARIMYTYQIIDIAPVKVGQEWSAPVNWSGRVRAVVFPWEVEIRAVQIINIYHEHHH
jgi:hypothetical protein